MKAQIPGIADDNHVLAPHKKDELLLLGANMIVAAKVSFDAVRQQRVSKAGLLDLPNLTTSKAVLIFHRTYIITIGALDNLTLYRKYIPENNLLR